VTLFPSFSAASFCKTEETQRHCLDFPVFSAPSPAEETCFQQVESSAVEGTSHLLLFLKSEKIPDLL
jgi:hypothetical protein